MTASTTKALASLLALAAVGACRDQREMREPDQLEVSAADVHRFVDAWKQLDASDSTCAPLAEYFRRESRGLRAYRRKFDVDQRELCSAVRRWPQWYAPLESKLGALDSATSQIRVVFDMFAALHQIEKTPAVYFVVGNGISGGTTTRGRHPIILVGMELNRSVDGLPEIIAHELVHTQQDYPLLSSATGGPTFMRGPVVVHSIKEGSANFIAELLTGVPHRNEYGEQHEAQLWAEFQRDASSKDYSRWLYNGWNKKALGERPPDLGYWVGYRIVKSYYGHAADKRQALSDILSIRDFDAFLKASKYSGGDPVVTE